MKVKLIANMKFNAYDGKKFHLIQDNEVIVAEINDQGIRFWLSNMWSSSYRITDIEPCFSIWNQ